MAWEREERARRREVNNKEMINSLGKGGGGGERREVNNLRELARANPGRSFT